MKKVIFDGYLGAYQETWQKKKVAQGWDILYLQHAVVGENRRFLSFQEINLLSVMQIGLTKTL
ncbi:MAG: hypothetical protein RR138_00100 [Akkermansia sp.]